MQKITLKNIKSILKSYGFDTDFKMNEYHSLNAENRILTIMVEKNEINFAFVRTAWIERIENIQDVEKIYGKFEIQYDENFFKFLLEKMKND